MYYPRCSTSATWSELQLFVQQDQRYVGRLYKRFRERPFTFLAFEELQLRGIRVEYKVLENCVGEVEIFPTGSSVISLDTNLWGYQRDVTVFHELMHVWYHPLLNDSSDLKDKRRYLSNAARTEWLARNARMQPDLLREVVEGLDIPKQIYDKASYLAFEPTCRRNRDKKKWKHTLRD
ncbi:ImmA/IrrE family metallo-endopeptidase [Candidatus Woesearchaeota archaeon]|nr:ImmA/IrrE family metallo-endopeptidase [Candidatus Woesearchaeota archaeon]